MGNVTPVSGGYRFPLNRAGGATQITYDRSTGKAHLHAGKPAKVRRLLVGISQCDGSPFIVRPSGESNARWTVIRGESGGQTRQVRCSFVAILYGACRN